MLAQSQDNKTTGTKMISKNELKEFVDSAAEDEFFVLDGANLLKVRDGGELELSKASDIGAGTGWAALSPVEVCFLLRRSLPFNAELLTAAPSVSLAPGIVFDVVIRLASDYSSDVDLRCSIKNRADLERALDLVRATNCVIQDQDSI